MAEQINFRSAIRGFNRTDVVRHIEFLKNIHEVKLNQLHTEIEELRAELNLARQLPARGIQLEAELEASKALCAELERKLAMAPQSAVVPAQDNLSSRCTDLEAQLADLRQRLADAENRAAQAEDAHAAAQRRIDELESALPAHQPVVAEPHGDPADAQRIADLDAALAASEQRIAELEQALADAQAAAVAAPSDPKGLQAQELAAYRRAERVERMALARARDIATQASGVLHDATARVDEDALELSDMFDQLTAQLDLLRNRMIASKSTLKDAVIAMNTISTAEDEE